MAKTLGIREKPRIMATSNFLIFLRGLFCSLLVLCLLFCSENASAHEGVRRETPQSHHQQHGHVIKISDLLPAPVCSTSTSNPQGLNGKTFLKVVHKHGPCSKYGSKQKAKPPTPTQILLEDQSRVKLIQSRLTNGSKQDQVGGSEATVPTHSGYSLGTGNYIVTVGIGSPKREFSIIFDTGSDLTWIQCQPCVGSCYKQQEPIFDPSKSFSYSNITCNANECSSLKSSGIATACTSPSTCVYGIQYGDKSYSIGYFGHETLTLTSSDVFYNFMFGCGEKNRGLFGNVAGLLGLGRSKISMISQTYNKYGGRFSYCLPSTSSSTGYLAFGHHRSSKSPEEVKFTPLLVNPDHPSFYFLDLIAISVGEDELPIPASVFATSGTIIDSGTVITWLPPTAYSILSSSFQKFMSSYSYPEADAVSILDTCYDFTEYDAITLPNIALNFRGGIAVDMDPSGILYYVGNGAQFCLAFTRNSDDVDIAIFGNTQQQKLDVIYDVAKGRLGFGPGGCS